MSIFPVSNLEIGAQIQGFLSYKLNSGWLIMLISIIIIILPDVQLSNKETLFLIRI